ncbi:MAG: YqgE/AlgH family protein [Planctomycetes bacterium]|nr:YqgE/AlgH family protein [Planctomycetota bacterium]
MESMKGHLLIASPELLDDDFAETVILLVEHTPEGAYGLTLNQPSDLTVRDAWAQNNDVPCLVEGLVYAGGPCGEFLTALHTDPAASNIEVIPGLYFTQEPAKLTHLIQQLAEPLKLFVGFAGWDQDQLEAELERGSWLTTRVSPEHVFGFGDDLWPRLARQVFGARTISALRIKHRPDDPSIN